jgi:hypothetical protein
LLLIGLFKLEGLLANLRDSWRALDHERVGDLGRVDDRGQYPVLSLSWASMIGVIRGHLDKVPYHGHNLVDASLNHILVGQIQNIFFIDVCVGNEVARQSRMSLRGSLLLLGVLRIFLRRRD